MLVLDLEMDARCSSDCILWFFPIKIAATCLPSPGLAPQVQDPAEAAPFLPQLMPLLDRVANEAADPELREVSDCGSEGSVWECVRVWWGGLHIQDCLPEPALPLETSGSRPAAAL